MYRADFCSPFAHQGGSGSLNFDRQRNIFRSGIGSVQPGIPNMVSPSNTLLPFGTNLPNRILRTLTLEIPVATLEGLWTTL